MTIADWVRRADEVLHLGAAALDSLRETRYGEWVDSGRFAAFRTSALSFLANVFDSQHPYYTDFAERVRSPQASSVRIGVGILGAARAELAGGWLRTTRGLLSAEIFADFLEMADHLVAEHYKDAAAVIAGSALEEHLRQVATMARVPVTIERGDAIVPKKADALNADLAGAGVYTKLDQKSVSAWLDLRNRAAHGRYSEYDEQQVAYMIEGVRQFIVRVTV